MIWFKACPKCRVGDLYLDQDQYGEYIRCFQCGYNQDLPNKAVTAPQPVPSLHLKPGDSEQLPSHVLAEVACDIQYLSAWN